jgi:outer membrane protein insertion porin family
MTSYTSGTRTMPRIFEVCATAWLLLSFSVQAVQSQQAHQNEVSQYFIERLEVEGNRRIQAATILSHILTRAGALYNTEAVQRDAQALRDTGYFEDVSLSVEDSPHRPDGKIVVFALIEKPIILRVEYRGIRSVTESDILRAFKNNKITLSVESRFDETMLTRAASVIEGLLLAHGHSSATVKPTYGRIVSLNAVSIVFNVDEGPKARSPKDLP